MLYACTVQIEGLETLSVLRRLDLSTNRISAVDGLQQLSKLEKLHLEGNQVNAAGICLSLAVLPTMAEFINSSRSMFSFAVLPTMAESL